MHCDSRGKCETRAWPRSRPVPLPAGAALIQGQVTREDSSASVECDCWPLRKEVLSLCGSWLLRSVRLVTLTSFPHGERASLTMRPGNKQPRESREPGHSSQRRLTGEVKL